MSKNLDIQSSNLDIHNENDASMSKNLDIGIKVKINDIDIVDIINTSGYSNNIKVTLMSIFNEFFNDIFSRTDVTNYLKVSNASGTNYINYLLSLNVIEQVKGLGKGKYKFK